MTNRLELESALAKAEATRKELEAALARERATLVDSVTNAAASEREREEANARILRARAHCRELQAALAALKNAEAEARPSWPIDILGRHADGLHKAAAGASAPSLRTSLRAVRAEHQRQFGGAERQRARFWSATSFTVRKLNPRAQTLLRHTVGLTALILAFLQYYFLDVELEIAHLHPIVNFAFH